MKQVAAIVVVGVLAGTLLASPGVAAAWDAASGILIAGATVVTMDDDHTVIPHGRVLIRDGRIVAVWSGPKPPTGIDVGNASVVNAKPTDMLFPGLINLHSHPDNNFLHTWLPPSSHAIPAQGKAGTDAYANRYQWNGSSSPPELRRLVTNPRGVLGDVTGLGLHGEAVKYAEVAALLGGETAIQGASPNLESDRILVRNIDNGAFNSRIARPRVGSIESFGGPDLANLVAGMKNGSYDAWMLHLAEGVRDSHRRDGDPVSSRAELQILADKGLLTDMTVVLHGTALERSDFAQMRAAQSTRTDGTGDGLGAKLVWSPLSNLLLYGETTDIYAALAEGVVVSLGTDWTPSGSRNLLHELKVAAVALRDHRLLGLGRNAVPALAVDGRDGHNRRLAEAALDQALADMVTRNPAKSLRWYDKVGSIEAGKIADMVLVRQAKGQASSLSPKTVYRQLIEATEREIALVLVGGEPLAGDVGYLASLKPGDFETVESAAGQFQKAVDMTTTAPVPGGADTLATITGRLRAGLDSLGGDHPLDGGGPGRADNTYSYLKAHVSGGAAAGLPDSVFRGLLGANVGILPDGSLNLERLQLLPLFQADDDFLRLLLLSTVDSTPPYALYPANLNFPMVFGDL